MDQQIGITYSVKGAESVIRSFEDIGRGLQQFLTRLETVEKGFGRIEAIATRFNTQMKEIRSSLSQMRYSGRAAAQGFGDLKRELSEVSGVAKTTTRELGLLGKTGILGRGITPIAPLGKRGGGEAVSPIVSPTRGGGRAAAQKNFLGGYGPFGFMARFMLFHQMLQAGRYGLVDIGMGRNRVEIDEALGELSAVSFNRINKQGTEIAGQRWAAKYGAHRAEDYIKAMSQTASAFSVNQLGTGILQQINEAALVNARLSKMQPEAAAEMLSKQLNAYLAAQPAAVYQAIQSGGRANVRGFGNVNLGEMAQKYIAMTAKTIEKSTIWGKGVMDFMQYAGPVMASQGWSPAGMLAWAGALADVGFKPARSGRAMKDIMLRAPENYARLMMASEGTLRIGAKGKYKEAQEEEVRRRAALIRQTMTDSKQFAEFLGKAIVPAMEHAQKLTRDPKYALSLIKDFGFSRQFIPQLLAIARPGFLERLFDLQGVEKAQFAEARKKFEASVDSIGYSWQRMTAAATRVAQGMAKRTGPLNEAVNLLTRALNAFAEPLEKRAILDEAMKQVKERVGATGIYEYDPMAKGKPTIVNEINKIMRDEWLRGKAGLGPPPGPQAPQVMQDAYRKRKAALREEVKALGRSLYFETSGEKEFAWQKSFDTGPVNRFVGVLGTATDKLFSVGKALDSFRDRIVGFTLRKGAIEPMSPGGTTQQILPNQMAPSLSTPPTEGQVTPDRVSQAPTPNVNVRVVIGDREIRDMFVEAVFERGMENRNPWGYRGV